MTVYPLTNTTAIIKLYGQNFTAFNRGQHLLQTKHEFVFDGKYQDSIG